MFAVIIQGGLLGLLFFVAIACVIIWGIVELVKWSQVAIPRPIVIIFIVLASIAMIYIMFDAFEHIVGRP